MAPASTTYYGTTYYGACVDYFSCQAEERDAISRHLALPAAQIFGGKLVKDEGTRCELGEWGRGECAWAVESSLH